MLDFLNFLHSVGCIGTSCDFNLWFAKATGHSCDLREFLNFLLWPVISCFRCLLGFAFIHRTYLHTKTESRSWETAEWVNSWPWEPCELSLDPQNFGKLGAGAQAPLQCLGSRDGNALEASRPATLLTHPRLLQPRWGRRPRQPSHVQAELYPSYTQSTREWEPW